MTSPTQDAAERAEPDAWMHVQGNHQEPSLRRLDDDEKARGWTEYPLYRAALSAPQLAGDAALTDAYAEGRRDEQQELASVLPGTTYMDPPDGGSPTILEQLQRQARDAKRYLWLRDAALAHDATRNAVNVYEFVGPIAYGPNIDAAIDTAIQQQEGK
jgi:hypothetical protein